MIFNLFKSKPSLKELIPKGFVDIHSHILPGIDDGAKNIEDSLKLIEEMYKLGFNKMIATPHTYPGLYNNSNQNIIESYNLIFDKIKNEYDIGYASEYMCDDSIYQRIENNSLLTFKGKHVLIEMSFMAMYNNFYDLVFKLKLNKYQPILAHPERYLYIGDNFNEFRKIKKYGCKFQLNLLSITGHYGNQVLKISEKLLEENLIDFVGSDIHNLAHIKKFENKIKINNIKKLEKAINNNLFFI